MLNGEDGVEDEGIKVISDLGNNAMVAGCVDMKRSSLWAVYERSVMTDDALAE